MLIYGKNVIKEAVFQKRKIYNLYIDEKMTDHQFIRFLKDKDIEMTYKSKGELNSMTENAVHQGVVADVKAYEYHQLSNMFNPKVLQRFLILDGIEDPHNLGAIMRTAEACQFTGIILSKKQQVPLNATVAKVSSGAIEHVPIILVPNLHQTILFLKEHNVTVVGTDGKAVAMYDEIPTKQSVAIVLGNEGEGIRPLIKQHCNLLVKIPMHGKINSLNVSVAAALMMYQAIRE